MGCRDEPGGGEVIPQEAIDRAVEIINRNRKRVDARETLERILPIIEAAIREQVAKEIEESPVPPPSPETISYYADLGRAQLEER